MLGQDLIGEGVAGGHEVTALARGELDVADAESARRAIESARPDVVINCAAWTDVDGAENAADAALAVNGTGAGNVAAAANAAGAWTIQVSTDYVFDGAKPEPYVESDPVGPLSQYGISKLAGELAVTELAPDSHTIVRTSWLFGVGGGCFPATIMRLAGEREQLTVVDDQRGVPHVHRASGERPARAGGPAAARDRARGWWRPVHLVRVRDRNRRVCEARVRGAARHQRRSGSTRPTPGEQRAGDRSRGRARRGCPSGAMGWRTTSRRRGVRHEVAGLWRRRIHRLDVRAAAGAGARRRRNGARQADLCGSAGEPRPT